ncbi:O-antigen ligase family protein [Paenibacillus gansuensis]|uniref:O-antigen ligase family protein n=1 Tax=Paenibacillus gansuensis TaxID=306542 RepID=A0ABW5PJ28_9BACL
MNTTLDYRSGRPELQKPVEEKSSIIYWCVMGFIGLFLFIAPYYAGLFNGDTVSYEKPIFSALIWASIILLLVGLYFFYHWNFHSTRDLFSIAIWLIPGTYIISLMNAASHHFAIMSVYINVMYAIFFIMGLYFAQRHLGASLLQRMFILSGYVVTWFGLLTFFGNHYYRDAVMLEQGIRLTSVFQYANAYAAFLMAVLFCGAFMVVRSTKASSILFHGFMLVPVMLSFLLTLSRGGIVVTPFIILLILPFLTVHRQILFILHLTVAGILSVAISSKITSIGLEIANKVLPTVQGKTAETYSIINSLSIAGWWRVILMSVVAAAVSFAIQKFAAPWLESKLKRISSLKYSQIGVPIAAVALGGLGIFLLFGNSGFVKVLPETMQVRIQSINFNTHSVLERETFYRDAVKIIKDYPVFGAGGGGWSALYQKYQNNPYSSKQAHNFILQYLVEVGIVGFLVFLGFLAWVIFTYVKNYLNNEEDEAFTKAKKHTPLKDLHFVFYIIAVTLLVHSVIDFEMSYVYMGCLLFISLGAMVSKTKSLPNTFKEKVSNPSVRWIYPSVVSLLSVVFMFMFISNLSANNTFSSAMGLVSQQRPLQEIMVPLDKAIERQPTNPYFINTKIDFVQQAYTQTQQAEYLAQAEKLIEKLEPLEPHDRLLFERTYRQAQLVGDQEKVINVINKGLVDFPWEISLYERKAETLFTFYLTETQNTGNPDNDKLKPIFEVMDVVQAKTKELEKLPKEQLRGRVFGITPSLSLTKAKIEFTHKNYQGAIDLIKPSLSTDYTNGLNRVMAKWYLAATIKLGQKDTAIYDTLLANTTEDTRKQEEQEIQNLVNLVK